MEIDQFKNKQKNLTVKNVIFIKYQGDFVPCKLNMTKAYYDKTSNTNDKRNVYELFSISFFQIQQKLKVLCL